jgi:hypothetical protein
MLEKGSAPKNLKKVKKSVAKWVKVVEIVALINIFVRID